MIVFILNFGSNISLPARIAEKFSSNDKTNHTNGISAQQKLERISVVWVHGGDPQKMVIMGRSAGAHLVALLATNQ